MLFDADLHLHWLVEILTATERGVPLGNYMYSIYNLHILFLEITLPTLSLL